MFVLMSWIRQVKQNQNWVENENFPANCASFSQSKMENLGVSQLQSILHMCKSHQISCYYTFLEFLKCVDYHSF